jgi:hypothetical protein
LSPLLFGIYIDALEKRLLEVDCDAPKLVEWVVPLLRFADDLVLVSLTLTGLQRQLDILQEFCRVQGLSVNLGKTKAMFFGLKGPRPIVQYGGAPVAFVEAFKYLGLEFHANGSFRKTATTQLDAALKAKHALRRRCASLGILDPTFKVKQFDALVAPILSYGCEFHAIKK